jgi:hypothetical protein
MALMSKNGVRHRLYGWLRRKLALSLVGNKHTLGYRASAETKIKLSAAKKGRKQSPEHVANRIAPLRGRKRPPLSAEWRANMSSALLGNKNNLGRKLSEEQKASISAFHTGRPKPPRSAEWRAAKSAAMRGIKRGPRSAQARTNMAAAGKLRIGQFVSAETRAKMSAAHKGNQTWLGRKHSAETKKKISSAKLGAIPWNKGKTHKERRCL